MSKTTTKTTSTIKGVLPTAGYVLIEPQELEKRTSSGIYLPDSSTEEKPQQGKILSVGADEITEKGVKRPCPAKKGDTVIYKKWGGNEVKFGNEEYMFVKFEDILAVIK